MMMTMMTVMMMMMMVMVMLMLILMVMATCGGTCGGTTENDYEDNVCYADIDGDGNDCDDAAADENGDDEMAVPGTGTGYR